MNQDAHDFAREVYDSLWPDARTLSAVEIVRRSDGGAEIVFRRQVDAVALTEPYVKVLTDYMALLHVPLTVVDETDA